MIDLHTIRLRNIACSDAPMIRYGVAQERVARFLSQVPHPYPKRAEYQFVSDAMQNKRVMVVAGRVNGMESFLGMGGVHEPRDGVDADCELGFWVDPDYWGQGVGARAIELLVKWADKVGHKRIAAGVMKDNLASARVFEKLGFERVGDVLCPSAAREKDVSSWVFLKKIK